MEDDFTPPTPMKKGPCMPRNVNWAQVVARDQNLFTQEASFYSSASLTDAPAKTVVSDKSTPRRKSTPHPKKGEVAPEETPSSTKAVQFPDTSKKRMGASSYGAPLVKRSDLLPTPVKLTLDPMVKVACDFNHDLTQEHVQGHRYVPKFPKEKIPPFRMNPDDHKNSPTDLDSDEIHPRSPDEETEWQHRLHLKELKEQKENKASDNLEGQKLEEWLEENDYEMEQCNRERGAVFDRERESEQCPSDEKAFPTGDDNLSEPGENKTTGETLTPDAIETPDPFVFFNNRGKKPVKGKSRAAHRGNAFVSLPKKPDGAAPPSTAVPLPLKHWPVRSGLTPEEDEKKVVRKGKKKPTIKDADLESQEKLIESICGFLAREVKAKLKLALKERPEAVEILMGDYRKEQRDCVLDCLLTGLERKKKRMETIAKRNAKKQNKEERIAFRAAEMLENSNSKKKDPAVALKVAELVETDSSLSL